MIGAAIGFLSNGIGNIANGQNFFSGGLKAAAFGAIGGGVSSAIGGVASGIGNSFGRAAFQAGAHALSGGGLSAAQGGNFWQGAVAGGISSGIGSGIDALGGAAAAQWLGGGLSGGVGSAIVGGSFWNGVGQGLITGGLNHAAHSLFSSGPPWAYNGEMYETKESLYAAILADQAAEQFGLKDVAALGGIALGAPILSTRGKVVGATRGTSIASKYLSKIPGKSPVKLPTLTGVPKLAGGKGLRFSSTRLIGRFIGRSIPIVGWGVLGYDAGVTIYRTTTIYNGITSN